MLICMCRSLKDFIKGYCNKLGQELLSVNDYDTDAEVRRLELLKRNFPPDTFLRCDIMLRDVNDSRRLDKSVHKNPGISSTLHAIIVSRKYWPGGDDDDEDENENEDYENDDENEANANLKLWPSHQEYSVET